MASDTTSAPHFFVLDRDMRGPFDTEFEKVTPNLGEGPDCPKCGKPIGSREWLPPYRIKLDLYGKEPGDFIRGFGYGNLITQRLADAFREEGLTGWSGFHPVEVVRVRRQRRGPRPGTVPTYLFVAHAFGGAVVDEVHSRIRRKQPISCDWCHETGIDATYGFCLDPGSWTGEDIFAPRGKSGSIVVSERFVRFVQQHGFTNMRFTPTEEYVWDPLARGPPEQPPGSSSHSSGT